MKYEPSFMMTVDVPFSQSASLATLKEIVGSEQVRFQVSFEAGESVAKIKQGTRHNNINLM